MGDTLQKLNCSPGAKFRAIWECLYGSLLISNWLLYGRQNNTLFLGESWNHLKTPLTLHLLPPPQTSVLLVGKVARVTEAVRSRKKWQLRSVSF